MLCMSAELVPAPGPPHRPLAPCTYTSLPIQSGTRSGTPCGRPIWQLIFAAKTNRLKAGRLDLNDGQSRGVSLCYEY